MSIAILYFIFAYLFRCGLCADYPDVWGTFLPNGPPPMMRGWFADWPQVAAYRADAAGNGAGIAGDPRVIGGGFALPVARAKYGVYGGLGGRLPGIYRPDRAVGEVVWQGRAWRLGLLSHPNSIQTTPTVQV